MPAYSAREGAASRMIRESEDLLELEGIKLRGQEYAVKILRIKKGNPRIDSIRSGDFFCPAESTHGLKR